MCSNARSLSLSPCSLSFLSIIGERAVAALARAPEGLLAVVVESGRTLCRRPRPRSNAPTVSSFPPRRNSTVALSFVPPPRSLRRVSLTIFLFLSQSSFSSVSSGKPRREQSSKTDRRQPVDGLVVALATLAAKPYYSLLRILSCTLLEASMHLAAAVRDRDTVLSIPLPFSWTRVTSFFLAINIYFALLMLCLINRR